MKDIELIAQLITYTIIAASPFMAMVVFGFASF